jgi:hypothetical protein
MPVAVGIGAAATGAEKTKPFKRLSLEGLHPVCLALEDMRGSFSVHRREKALHGARQVF